MSAAAEMKNTRWETVIGLEVHVQLNTESKLFCPCPNKFGGEPNTHICPVCAGMPGALPVTNSQAVALAVKAGLAFGCEINLRSIFSRKSYFYPDLPGGFQTSQFEPPICGRGRLDVSVNGHTRIVRINRIHMEDDAGKCIHTGGGKSEVDLNRAGTPLVEIVTEPDLRGPAEAVEFLRQLRRVLVYLGVTDGNMEEGSVRCDVNVSLRPEGSARFGTRTELKNLNSFNAVREAAECEVERQAEILNSGGTVGQETRLYDPDSGTTRAMRSKEEAPDYRYFPNPDLPAVCISAEFAERIRQSLPEMPDSRQQRFMSALGLNSEEASVLVGSATLADYFEAVLASWNNPKRSAGIILGELLPEAARRGSEPQNLLPPAALAHTVRMLDDGKISLRAVHELFAELLDSGQPIEVLAEKHGLLQVSDSSALEEAVLDAVAANPKEVADYKGGKVKLLSFFVGRVMRATKGAGNPAVINELLKKHLEG